MEDKRKHKRYSKPLNVRYSCAKGPLIIESESKSQDISAGGIRLSLDENLKVSDRVRLAIDLPWMSRSLDAIAKVVWASPRLTTGAFTIQRDCGLEFNWTSVPDVQEAIKI